ncbi:MAG: hypothetical protein ACLGG7_02695 [Bacteriovoracia bacterium]
MKNFFLSSIALAVALPVFAQDFCQPQGEREVQSVKLDSTPNYFFKTSADGRWIYYITNNKNYALDTTTGVSTELNGAADPVPSGDGKILTTLGRDPRYPNGWSFSVVPLKDGLPARSDETIAYIPGSYQSVGDLRADGTRPVMFYDETNSKVKVFALKEEWGQFKLADELVYEQQDSKNLRLPMMSPDGKRFSALNVDTNQTEIYEIGPDGRSAKLLRSLPFAGGKAAFSYDGKKITFHVSRDVAHHRQTITHDSYYPATLDATSQVRNVYVYDLETDAVQQVTNNTKGNSYFPIFLGDGRVAYIHKDHNSSKFLISYSTVPKGQQRSVQLVSDCLGAEADQQLDALSNTWASICSSWQRNSDKNGAGLATILALSLKDCEDLVKRSGDPALGRVCQALGNVDKRAMAVKKKSPGEELLTNRCLICHGEDKAWFAQNKKKVLASVSHRDPQQRMPRGGRELTVKEKADLKSYLDSFK